jgi:hypothetical protein
MVVHASNPIYLGGGRRRITTLRPAQAKIGETLLQEQYTMLSAVAHVSNSSYLGG